MPDTAELAIPGSHVTERVGSVRLDELSQMDRRGEIRMVAWADGRTKKCLWVVTYEVLRQTGPETLLAREAVTVQQELI